MRIPGVKYVQGRNSYDDRDDTKYGIAIHNTSNTASAANEASYATRRTDGVSAHIYVDGTELIQSIDLLARTGHAGSSNGNENAVSVEITGLNSWTRQQWLDRVNWSALGSALAWVCKQFGIQVRHASVAEMKSNPRVRAFYSHDDMRRAWGGTDHTDPGGNFPWDRLFQAVSSAGGGGTPASAGGDPVSNFMIQINGDPTIYLSDGFKYRGLSDWNAFLTYRDVFKWPYVVVNTAAELAQRAGRYDDGAAPAQAVLSDAQVARIEAAAKAGALGGAGGVDLDALRAIVDDETISEEEIAERFGSKA
jgi:hypothetical protein